MNRIKNQLGSITGHVVNTSNLPIQDVAIVIVGNSPTHSDIAALTDENGMYNFKGLLAGQYTLLANAQGYKPQTKRIIVTPSAETSLNFEMQSV